MKIETMIMMLFCFVAASAMTFAPAFTTESDVGNSNYASNDNSCNDYAVNGVTVVESGECGDGVNYELTSDGLLNIYYTGEGTGIMKSFFHNQWHPHTAPWYGDHYTKVVIGEGVKNIGTSAFWGGSDLVEIEIAGSVSAIGPFSFNHCNKLTKFTIAETDGDIIIGLLSMCNCASLRDVYIEGVNGSIFLQAAFFEKEVNLNIGFVKGQVIVGMEEAIHINVPDGVEIVRII